MFSRCAVIFFVRLEIELPHPKSEQHQNDSESVDLPVRLRPVSAFEPKAHYSGEHDKNADDPFCCHALTLHSRCVDRPRIAYGTSIAFVFHQLKQAYSARRWVERSDTHHPCVIPAKGTRASLGEDQDRIMRSDGFRFAALYPSVHNPSERWLKRPGKVPLLICDERKCRALELLPDFLVPGEVFHGDL
jgi:hypothetical protein